jgi:hypothetical protein
MKCSLQRWTLLKSDVSWKLCWSQWCGALLRCLFSMCAVQAVCQSHISFRSVLITSLVLGLAEVFVLSMCAVWAVCWLLEAEGPCRSGEGPCNWATVATYALHSPLVSWHMCYAWNLSTAHLLSHKPDLTSTHMHELKLMYKLPFLKSVPNFDTDAIFLDSWCVCEQHHSTHPCNVLLQITKSLTVLLLGNVVCLFVLLCSFCQIEISQTTGSLALFLVPLESHHLVRPCMHWGDFEMFKPAMQELLNFEYFYCWKFNESQNKFF